MSYDFVLDMSTRNSNSVILNNISPGTFVLEVGCAYGRMTKYLKEQLGCTVDVVEVDRKSGKNAYQYARFALIGASQGNVEKRVWFESLQCRSKPYVSYYTQNVVPPRVTYDYVIFADVLEHLYKPKLALTKCVKLLEPNGKVWISVPNISHNAVLIDLFKDKFQYRELGLLDKTHIKFFTQESLEQLVDECGLKVFQKEDLPNKVENTEFNNSYDDLPLPVADYLRDRPNGEIYQFVWGLEKK